MSKYIKMNHVELNHPLLVNKIKPNILDLDQICDIADRVYFDVINYLNIEHKCIEDDPDSEGTKNTEFGSDLYFLIEDAIEKSINYQR